MIEKCCTVKTHQDRKIDIPGLVNARDLGNVSITMGRKFRRGVLIRGESPQFLTTDGLNKMLEYGVSDLLDLRTETEVRSEGYGLLESSVNSTVKIHHLPIIMDKNWSKDPIGSGKTHKKSVSFHNWLLEGGVASVVRLVDVINNAEGVCYIHCAAGKDRTGVVTSILYALADVQRCCIEQDYLITNEYVIEVLNKLGKSKTYIRDLKKPDLHAQLNNPGEITEFLDLVRGTSSIEEWLKSKGLSEESILKYREKVIK